MEQNTNPANKPTPAVVKAFEFFKPGTFTAVNGQTYTFDAAAVRELVDSYRPEFSDAPLVVGHPKLTSPRFGRAEKLFVNDQGVAMCEAGGLVPEFAAMVNAGMYPKVSAAIYMPNAKGNPTPGKHYLNHIGFLGGVAPAVKGLEMVQFAAAETDDGIVSFGDWDDRVTAGILRNLRNWFIGKFGQDEADKAIAEWGVQALSDSAAQPESSFSTTPTTQLNPQEIDMDAAQLAELTAFKAREADLIARETALASQAQLAAQAEVTSFAEGLIASGKWLPANKDALVEVIGQLSEADQVARFAAADPAHTAHGKTGAQLLREMLSALPVQVSFAKLPDGAAAGTANFAAPDGAAVSAEGLDLMARAQAHQKTNPALSLIDAAIAVQAQG